MKKKKNTFWLIPFCNGNRYSICLFFFPLNFCIFAYSFLKDVFLSKKYESTWQIYPNFCIKFNQIYLLINKICLVALINSEYSLVDDDNAKLVNKKVNQL
jgi:hypothetical protein